MGVSSDTGFSADGTSGTDFPLESQSPENSGDKPMIDATTAKETPTTEPRKNDYLEAIQKGLRAYAQSEAFIPSLVAAGAVAIAFWSLWIPLYGLWTSDDGYYSHGFLVPFISGFIIYKWWPKLKDIPVRQFWPAAIPLMACLYLTGVGTYMQMEGLLAICLLGVLGFSVWMVAGFRWAIGLSPAILYLAFALPLWNAIISNNTNKLQILSTTMAYELLRAVGYRPIQTSPTIIVMDSGYPLDVAVPCSGLKLLVALTALTVFILLVGRLRWFANIVMLGLIIPLGLFINGLRIALIGMVGDRWGRDAAVTFHDWSGWITLIICFIVLSKIARTLGWQD